MLLLAGRTHTSTRAKGDALLNGIRQQPDNSMPSNDPLQKPETAFGKLDEAQYQAELGLVDRYQAFVAELLRLSLLGIAVFGYLYKVTFENDASIGAAKVPAALGVFMFGVCALTALAFRFFANEGARFYIQALRSTPDNADCTQEKRTKEQKHLAKEEQKQLATASLETRHKKVVICRWSKAIATSSLALGGVLEALAFCLLLFGLDMPREGP
jgi:hypothetical protein